MESTWSLLSMHMNTCDVLQGSCSEQLGCGSTRRLTSSAAVAQTQTEAPTAGPPARYCPRCHVRGARLKMTEKRATVSRGNWVVYWCSRCSFLEPKAGPFPHAKHYLSSSSSCDRQTQLRTSCCQRQVLSRNANRITGLFGRRTGGERTGQ